METTTSVPGGTYNISFESPGDSSKNDNLFKQITWKIIDQHFHDTPLALVDHHIETYNDFFDSGIQQIFNETNPIQIRKNFDKKTDDFRYKLDIYMGGKEGNKIHYGQPVVYDKDKRFMFPNEARLKNMTYATTVHYDIDVVCSVIDKTSGEESIEEKSFDHIFLGRFPILLHSKLCILSKVPSSMAFQMGECKNDCGGYFIIDGKEKCFIPQEKFADNMVYIKKNDINDIYTYSTIVRTVSEDVSKPERTLKIHIVRETEQHYGNQIVVDIPNVKKPVPLFILMRALGVLSDKEIIEYCLLNIEKNEEYVELFVPSIHDASVVFTQETAIQYLKTFTKQETINQVYEILVNYLLPNIGEDNFLHKAYVIGDMVYKLLRTSQGDASEIDRDNFRYKRIELLGPMMYDLFKEYYKQQQRAIYLNIERNEIYFHYTNPDDEEEVTLSAERTIQLFDENIVTYFNEKQVEEGFKKAFKGKWGSASHTKREGIIQDVNRLSHNSYKSLLRKLNLPLDASAKVVGPRLLHGSQWGYIDPIDTPDGGNVGTHKHMSIMTKISNNYSGNRFITWLSENVKLVKIEYCHKRYLYDNVKVVVNGTWFAVTEEPIEMVQIVKYYRRIGQIPSAISITFDIGDKTVYIYTDSGRLLRPIYYIQDKQLSLQEPKMIQLLMNGELKWNEIVRGKMIGDTQFPSIIDYIDSSESNDALIALYPEQLKSKNRYSHIEMEHSLLLGLMGNQVIFPEHNPPARNLFSCGQTKQAVSLYHSNFTNRFDKMSVVLNYGQNPIIKSKYSKYINNDEHPHGENTIVAIMSLNGYNVEDAILVNEGSIRRGLFRTTYYTTYETTEESSDVLGSTQQTVIQNVNENLSVRLKPGYDYNDLDSFGLVKENVPVDDRKMMIGKLSSSSDNASVVFDSSVKTKKGQLGFVDKTFLSDNEEGFRVAKVRIREERIPNIGDKMASRAGQKGTIGLIIPESDMPFTAEGLKPDLIINPHAIPSRMTIGQLVEMLLGKLCVDLGSFSDCTAFMNKGGQEKFYGRLLSDIGFHSSGNEIMYDGLSGKQLESNIFIGPTYYMRLKHMVKDKINHRGLGPRNVLTRQTVQGRANDGGLRIGEMERDGVIAHGMSSFLRESFMIRGDKYAVAICNHTGSIAIYNVRQKRFYSPLLNGPVKLSEPIQDSSTLENISQHGHSFSIIQIPYCLKLLIHELQTMNISIKLITEDNIKQLTNMNYHIDMENAETVNDTKLLLRKHANHKKKMEENKLQDVQNTSNIDSGVSDDNNKDNNESNVESAIQSDGEGNLVEPYGFWETGYTPQNMKTPPVPITPEFAPDSQPSSTPYRVLSSSESDNVGDSVNDASNDIATSIQNEIVQDISEYSGSSDKKKGENIITIKTEKLEDMIESAREDSILQPKSLDDSGEGEGDGEGNGEVNETSNLEKNISI